MFWLINIIDDVTAAILVEKKTVALSRISGPFDWEANAHNRKLITN